MYFIKEFTGLRICLSLFRYVFCRNLSKRVISIQFYTTVVSDGLHEPYLLLTNSSFILIFLIRIGDVSFGSNLSKFRSKNLKASLMSFTCPLYSDKVCCFNQSERALYRNFIINSNMKRKIVTSNSIFQISISVLHIF